MYDIIYTTRRINVLTSSMEDRGFETRSGQTKDY